MPVAGGRGCAVRAGAASRRGAAASPHTGGAQHCCSLLMLVLLGCNCYWQGAGWQGAGCQVSVNMAGGASGEAAARRIGHRNSGHPAQPTNCVHSLTAISLAPAGPSSLAWEQQVHRHPRTTLPGSPVGSGSGQQCSSGRQQVRDSPSPKRAARPLQTRALQAPPKRQCIRGNAVSGYAAR